MSNQDVPQGKVRPGLKAGRTNEFTLIMKLKPGGAERLSNCWAADSKFANKNEVFYRSGRYASRYEVPEFLITTPNFYLRRLLMVIGIHTLMTLEPSFWIKLIWHLENLKDIREFTAPILRIGSSKIQVSSTYFYMLYPNASVT